MSDLRDRIASGTLAQAGLLTEASIDRAVELVSEMSEALETVRVLFTDQHGILRGKTIVASALPGLFADGMAAPSTLLLKDTS
ncbi:MAG: glutamine synthetase, partial [Sulfitobacter sp.]|nr:glutamine synthetase [Sulfitobacter sp.]